MGCGNRGCACKGKCNKNKCRCSVGNEKNKRVITEKSKA